MTRPELETKFKNAFIEAANKAKEQGVPYGVYTPDMLYALSDMARHDIYPDGRFGDLDCNMWSVIARVKNGPYDWVV